MKMMLRPNCSFAAMPRDDDGLLPVMVTYGADENERYFKFDIADESEIVAALHGAAADLFIEAASWADESLVVE
ncbi:hypothetical protein UFOVP32_24 [uncultured Caudovirales phage]|uniref:Uncharacterized protein n=1 Tax=uncultured Caudovirales phage TaxID=2100421 RepID=A0A6J5KR51_9CAUD|nr:hypothetical protein UFOVP32_24 [uncultured Caudovirales phage]CAB4123736.1 hypothetical protein UFOVP50_52 [uncultured Caudovirales phage]